MADPCTGPRGEDVCHLAQGPPRVDFTLLPQLRKAHAEAKEAKTKQKLALKQLRKKAVRAEIAPRKVPREPLERKSTAITEAPTQVMPVEDDATEPPANYRQTNPRLRPNTQSLSTEEMDKARMVRAGKTFMKQGALAAQAQLDSTLSERGWTVDRELSSTEGLVLKKGG